MEGVPSEETREAFDRLLARGVILGVILGSGEVFSAPSLKYLDKNELKGRIPSSEKCDASSRSRFSKFSVHSFGSQPLSWRNARVVYVAWEVRCASGGTASM